MKCSICLNEPPVEPVSTADGSIYCLNCISAWFEAGKITSPDTNKKVAQILFPTTSLCRELNIPITIIPDKYLATKENILKKPKKILYMIDSNYTELNNIKIIDELAEKCPPRVNMSEIGYKILINEINDFYDIIIENYGDCILNEPKFLNHKLKINNTPVYKYTFSSDRKLSHYKKVIPIAVDELFDIFHLIDTISYLENELYLMEYFISLIPLKIIYNKIFIERGYDRRFNDQQYYTKYNLINLTKFELFKLIEFNRKDININLSTLRDDLIEILVKNPIEIKLNDWLEMYKE